MRCPKCKLENPSTAQRCDCGYDFAAGEMRKPYLRAAAGAKGGASVRDIVKSYKLNDVLGQRWAALIVDLFIFIVMLITPGLIRKSESDAPLIAVALLIPVYFIVLEGRWGATLGKLAAKIRVVDERGAVPGYWKAFLRTLLRLVEVNPIVIGGLPAAIVVAMSEYRQRLGDMIAGTYVLTAADTLRVRQGR
jgi:uncharacterized RDD family membrane protein YckC